MKIRYLRTYLHNPLTIDSIKAQCPTISPLLLNGFQASSFPITAQDFHEILSLLGEEQDELPIPNEPTLITLKQLAQLEQHYLYAAPEVREIISRRIERGAIGDLVKKANHYECQLCKALGREPVAFCKPDGQPYVEAHHVVPVAQGQVGSLSAANVISVCANHHRQLHYGGIHVQIGANQFLVCLPQAEIRIPRFQVDP